MAEKTNKEHLDNLINTQLGQIPDQTIFTNDLEPGNQKQDTEAMEVHKHPKHITHKKKWEEYVLEFFMLFLAVFLGFVAENIREHFVEKNKAKQYISGFIRDLQKDTAAIKEVIVQDTGWAKKLDTALSISKKRLTLVPTQDSLIYYIDQGARFLGTFTSTENSLIQLRSTGSFRLIENSKIIDSIGTYQSTFSALESQSTYYITVLEEFKTLYRDMIDHTSLPAFRASIKENGRIPDTMFLLISFDPHKIDVLYNYIYTVRNALSLYSTFLKEHDNTMKRLIICLQKEYHLDVE